MAHSEPPGSRLGFGWPARLHVVTGKGGTGKTTVAAALAMALAAGGRRTLLAEVEGRQGIAQLFDLPPLPYEERVVAGGVGGGEVRALAIDTELALLEYLDVFYHLGLAGKALRKMGAVDFATTVAPGMRDVLLTGKVKEAVTRTVDGRRFYDAVVVDAPPTGRVARFLNVSAETARLARVGPIKSQSEGVAAILRSPMTVVHVVTLLEEMPVQETADAIVELTRIGIPIGCVIVNATLASVLAGAEITQTELRRGLTVAGLSPDQGTVAGLVSEANAYQTRTAVEATLRGELAGLGPPLVELPALVNGVTREGLGKLAADLATHLRAG